MTELKFWVGTVHVLDGLILVFLVLLHSGKGGGLSDMFGGSLGSTAAGSTVAERNLDRITVVAALVFGFTTVGFALLL
ncbi:MAG: preprotein translocase subunit SecG [Acidimicrobiales bacterium]